MKWINGRVYHATDKLGEMIIATAKCSNCGRWASQITPFGMLSYGHCPWCGEEVKGECEDEL